jgi:hypothetical protein
MQEPIVLNSEHIFNFMVRVLLAKDESQGSIVKWEMSCYLGESMIRQKKALLQIKLNNSWWTFAIIIPRWSMAEALRSVKFKKKLLACFASQKA